MTDAALHKIEWQQGYQDGRHGCPNPGPSRSPDYKQGFMHGRDDDRRGVPGTPGFVLHAEAVKVNTEVAEWVRWLGTGTKAEGKP